MTFILTSLEAYILLATGASCGFIIAGIFASGKRPNATSSNNDRILIRQLMTRVREFERADKQRKEMLRAAGRKGAATRGRKAA